jgi:hypothetical protein
MTSEDLSEPIARKMNIAFVSEDEENCPLVSFKVENVTNDDDK